MTKTHKSLMTPSSPNI